MRTRITYGNVVSTLALFIALGGTGYAAVKLPAHSVGSRELRDHSVTARKLAKTAQPLSRAKLRSEITQVMTDPATGLNVTVHAQDGDVGPRGDAGPAGPQGIQGPKGDKGTGLGYARVGNGSLDTLRTSGNVTMSQPQANLYCFHVAGERITNVVANEDGAMASAPITGTDTVVVRTGSPCDDGDAAVYVEQRYNGSEQLIAGSFYALFN